MNTKSQKKLSQKQDTHSCTYTHIITNTNTLTTTNRQINQKAMANYQKNNNINNENKKNTDKSEQTWPKTKQKNPKKSIKLKLIHKGTAPCCIK